MQGIRPFWRYYGGKWRAAPKYPPPQYDTIVEPFAGAAGYSLRYPDREVILVEKDPIIAEVWRWLISASADDVMRVPLMDHVDDLPETTPQGARWLVGFCMNSATTRPCKSISSGSVRLRDAGRKMEGWGEYRRRAVAENVDRVKHWKILEGDYAAAPNVVATWFIDPPYSSPAGRYYKYSDVDYSELGRWCETRNGQTIVCENVGATWLPFEDFSVFRHSINNASGSREAVWYGGGGLVAGMRRNEIARRTAWR